MQSIVAVTTGGTRVVDADATVRLFAGVRQTWIVATTTQTILVVAIVTLAFGGSFTHETQASVELFAGVRQAQIIGTATLSVFVKAVVTLTAGFVSLDLTVGAVVF